MMFFKTAIEHSDTEEIVNSEYLNWENFRNKTIMITGATGLIGTQIVKALQYANERMKLAIKIIAMVRST